MINLLPRLLVCESNIREFFQRLGEVAQRLAKLEQLPWLAASGNTGGSDAQAVYVAMAPASGTYAGTWSGSAPTGGSAFSATVYQVSGGSTVTTIGTRFCINWMPAAVVNSKACILQPDGAGNYIVVSQSCV